ncbi:MULTISPECIES: 4'-phosphopantetheinyl transferase superfamily protein [unclassified Oceanispirochaeta]|uniref:4'-phosphopantetheinyl transferase family protein n=1 Tax=unclassified Oceanispirochaeta TaxID=2635722 RepID=UPI000E08D7A4|nr:MULTISPECIES: 4'-phosphopantetheinyl transferase superfamily protein [unclassified Oceanispirochaeta]MBF9015484.1 4'-phosphopantetheinyl transferase superfamily protein [Oceanispirochaeta sp. M2]NPD71943.1 4'-phosphopantetheinyl transferase superfamily protein [Oceanispirochaeta sp. M1]RDG32750.1 hypothetical protein DV872_07515 [Oceanispirochaeta sp. M1]
MKPVYISFVDLSINKDKGEQNDSIKASWKRILIKETAYPNPEIRTNSNGKPLIIYPEGWYYNISHSSGIAVSILGNIPVGIDIEKVSLKRDTKSLAEEYFRPEEIKYCCKSQKHFYCLWTRKEAWIKLQGSTVWQMRNTPDMSTATENIHTWQISDGETDYYLSAALDIPEKDKEIRIIWSGIENLSLSPQDSSLKIGMDEQSSVIK